MRKNVSHILVSIALVLLWSSNTHANELFLKINEHNWRLSPEKKGWIQSYKKYFLGGLEVTLPSSALAKNFSPYLESRTLSGIDAKKVKEDLKKDLSPEVERSARNVVIDQDPQGKITFEGFAMEGRTINLNQGVELIRKAIQLNPDEIHLPIETIAPTVEIKSQELIQKGIISLLATGETSFKGSPANRTTNIHVGLSKFNGVLIAPQAKFVLGEVLGAVDEANGYRKELVIKGDKTLPEFGGGLCQVSTTIYRGALFTGLPITQRKNHSYAVSYYNPQGLDATIYPPSVDLKFINDTPGYLLLQTMTTKDGKAYVNYYGTADARRVVVMGPRYYNETPVPPPRTEYTTTLPAGEKQKLGEAHGGFQASWFRQVTFVDANKPPIKDHIYSNYEARPLYYLIGAPLESVKKNHEQGTVSENGS